MIHSFASGGLPAGLEADVLVIGGGAVGLSILADRVRHGERTVLLEAGGPGLEESSQAIIRAARSLGHPHEGLHLGRFRLLGGTTHFWGGQLGRLDPIVFEPRAQVDGQGWPYGRAELDPWYDRADALLGIDRALPDGEVCRRAAIDPPGDGRLDYFFTRWLREPSLAHHFAAELRSPLATVLTHANVVGFAPLGDGRHEVVVRNHAGAEARLRARAVVLACGTFEIVRLLQLPYADGTATPWQANPWLGRAYCDHLDVMVGNVRVLDQKRFDALFENLFIDGFKYNPKLKLSEAEQRERQLLQACGAFVFATSYRHNAEMLRHFVRSLRRGRWPDNWRELPAHLLAIARIAGPMALRYLRANRAFHPRGSAVQLRICAEQIPIRTSAIRLGTELDSLGLPVTELDWRIDGRELETIVVCAEMIAARLAELGIAAVDLDPRVTRRDPALLAELGDTNHQMGGARLGISADDGVVDPDLKLFGAADLYVAGAAAMRTTGFINCTFTAIAMALRLSHHLREAHG